MKNYINKLIIFSLLSSTLALAMEDYKHDEQNPAKTVAGLPNEIWTQILEHVYFNSSILDEAKDIYEGIELIEKHIAKCVQEIPLVCKTFKDLSISKNQWANFKQKIRKFYIPHLNQRFLEADEGLQGLYPKDDRWATNNTIDNDIAQFISTESIEINLSNLLFRIISHNEKNSKLIKLLLFYGANPNLLDNQGRTALHKAASYHLIDHNNTEIITLLLKNGANPNLLDNQGGTALYWVALNHRPINRNNIDITTLLLQHGANPSIKNGKGKTAFDIAREKNFTEFPQLVRIHSQNTLKKICLQRVLTNLSLFKDQLHTLPIELQDTINSLKS